MLIYNEISKPSIHIIAAPKLIWFMVDIFRFIPSSGWHFGILYLETLSNIHTWILMLIMKVKKEAKIRNWYNQVPNATQDTAWESDINHKKTSHTRKPRGQPFSNRWPQGCKKQACHYGEERQITEKDQQKKHHLGTVSKKITGGLKLVSWSPLILMWIKKHRCLIFMKYP